MAQRHSSRTWNLTWCSSQSQISSGVESRYEETSPSHISKNHKRDDYTQPSLTNRLCFKIKETHTRCFCFFLTFSTVHHVVSTVWLGLENLFKSSVLHKHTCCNFLKKEEEGGAEIKLLKQVTLLELMVPQEDWVEEAQERKWTKYFVANFWRQGLKAPSEPMEVACWGLCKSVYTLSSPSALGDL